MKFSKSDLRIKIEKLLSENKTIDEIVTELNCPRKKIIDIRWQIEKKERAKING